MDIYVTIFSAKIVLLIFDYCKKIDKSSFVTHKKYKFMFTTKVFNCKLLLHKSSFSERAMQIQIINFLNEFLSIPIKI